MADIEITKNYRADKKVDVTCRECKRSTKHLILSDVCLKGCEDIAPYGDFIWYDEHQIVQCHGCETISFRKTHNNSEDLTHFIDIYPNPEDGRDAIDYDHLLPSNLQLIYNETIKSINFGQAVLTGMGIRAIVETVCKDINPNKDKNANRKDLCEKINYLVKQDILTKKEADILHKLRILGNEAAHEVKPHNNATLTLALDVIDHLLKGVYILPLLLSSSDRS
ncbi:DUF4145 domain-containing protein [Thiolapillus sp.]|uniref:DUF4145 domain-containing protein n=1 Tax=Thiolapillus sp. TaxID=2017437 RepID=UPI0025F67843|nr:DUF4145 domain-containing protein [Thiolapillus sp.]